MFIFTFKGLTACMLWSAKKIAIRFAIIESIVSLLFTCLLIATPPYSVKNRTDFVFILVPQLLIFIPYLIKLIKIKKAWEMK